MKIKHLTLSFLACAGLAGCAPSHTVETPYTVTCKDNAGAVTFEGLSKDGFVGSGDYAYTHVSFDTVDGRRHQQVGGLCTSRAASNAPYTVECKDNNGKVTFEKGLSESGFKGPGSYVHIDATDGSRFEQAGGICTSGKRAALKPN